MLQSAIRKKRTRFVRFSYFHKGKSLVELAKRDFGAGGPGFDYVLVFEYGFLVELFPEVGIRDEKHCVCGLIASGGVGQVFSQQRSCGLVIPVGKLLYPQIIILLGFFFRWGGLRFGFPGWSFRSLHRRRGRAVSSVRALHLWLRSPHSSTVCFLCF